MQAEELSTVAPPCVQNCVTPEFISQRLKLRIIPSDPRHESSRTRRSLRTVAVIILACDRVLASLLSAKHRLCAPATRTFVDDAAIPTRSLQVYQRAAQTRNLQAYDLWHRLCEQGDPEFHLGDPELFFKILLVLLHCLQGLALVKVCDLRCREQDLQLIVRCPQSCDLCLGVRVLCLGGAELSFKRLHFPHCLPCLYELLLQDLLQDVLLRLAVKRFLSLGVQGLTETIEL